MTEKKRKNTSKTFVLIFLYLFVQFFLYFNYSFLTAGWHNELAQYLLMGLTPLTIFLFFLSDKIKPSLLLKLLLYFNWAVTGTALLFAVFKPFVLSTAYFDLFLSQAVYVLNPGISLSFLFFITSSLILIRHLKKFNTISLFISVLPILIWLLLILIYQYQNILVFQD